MKRITAVTIVTLILSLLIVGVASAQDYDCTVVVGADGRLTLDCTPKPTPIPTATSTPTETPTATPTATVEPTATAIPPTATATATQAPPTLPPTLPVARGVVNVALLDTPSGPSNDANLSSGIWAGEMSPDGMYGQLRMMGHTNGLWLNLQRMTPAPGGSTVVITVRGVTYRIVYAEVGGWSYAERCANGLCRGWTAARVIPWASLGGKPQLGDEWPMSFTVCRERWASATDCAANGYTWAGVLRWGLPNYSGASVAGMQYIDVPITDAAMVGGGVNCGYNHDADYFATWGDSTTPIVGKQINAAQNQGDTADWPCYTRSLYRWAAPSLPPGAAVVSATLTLNQWGNAGYGPQNNQTTTVELWDVDGQWDAATVTWDNAPRPVENITRAPMAAISWQCPNNFCADAVPVTFDVTELVKRGANDAMAYTQAWDYHSGRYVWQPDSMRIWFILEGAPQATWTPQPSPTVQPTPTIAPTSTPLAPTASPTPSPTQIPTVQPTQGRAYYVSPTGSDANSGATMAAPFATFARAWKALYPGDTLFVMDGTYTEQLRPNVRNGQPGKPITVKALNDGKAIIDGQYKWPPVYLGDTWPGPIGNWYVVEGLVARNGTESVYYLRGSNNVLRRVSGYNAHTDMNSFVLTIAWSSDNLVEDAVFAGTGRYMINVFGAERNTIRRTFTMWDSWHGGAFCGNQWPSGNNIGIYNASHNTLENVIAYGRALNGIFVQANDIKAAAIDNQVLGSMAVLTGRDYDGSRWLYNTGMVQHTSRPTPTVCSVDQYRLWSWGGARIGVQLNGQGLVQDNLYRDIIAADNMGIGVSLDRLWTPGYMPWTNNVFDRVTAWDNGEDLADWELPPRNPLGPNASNNSDGGAAITNSKIAGLTGPEYNGAGADMRWRYVDRVQTSTPVMPWPMQGRIMDELGVNVEAIWTQYTQEALQQ
jgi:hypothetical protein